MLTHTLRCTCFSAAVTQYLTATDSTPLVHKLPLLLCRGAPPLQALVSVSVIGTQEQLGDEQLTAAVLKELSAWFGPDQVSTWTHLRTFRWVLGVALCACRLV